MFYNQVYKPEHTQQTSIATTRTNHQVNA